MEQNVSIWPGQKFEEIPLKKLKYGLRQFLITQIYLNKQDLSHLHKEGNVKSLTILDPYLTLFPTYVQQ